MEQANYRTMTNLAERLRTYDGPIDFREDLLDHRRRVIGERLKLPYEGTYIDRESNSGRVKMSARLNRDIGFGSNESYYGARADFYDQPDEIQKKEASSYPPNFPVQPKYIIRVTRHMDAATEPEIAAKRKKDELEDYYFETMYLIGEDGRIGKIIRLPDGIQDVQHRKIIGRPYNYSDERRVVGEVTDADKELINYVLHLLVSQANNWPQNPFQRRHGHQLEN